MIITEILKLLIVLAALVLCNIGLGITNSLTIDKLNFNTKFLLEGIIKGLIVGCAILVLAYACNTIDLSSLGFTPKTILTTGIAVYGAKVGAKVIKLLGLNDKLLADKKEA